MLRPVVCCGAGGEQKERLLQCWCSLIPAGTRARQLEKGGGWAVGECPVTVRDLQ